MSRRRELLLALALDVVLAEPSPAWHPVVWMGRLVDRLEARLPEPGHPRDLAAGAAAWAFGIAVVVALASAARGAPWQVRGVLLWTLLSGRMLVTEVAGVEAALGDGGLEAGRDRVDGLVSRDTDDLDLAQVRMAAVESLGENLSDSLVAPLAWWAGAGLPGAAAYRWVNTLDARWGYRTPAWERRGRVAARADDLANLVPARLTAVLLAGWPGRRLGREAARTASPNAGWPMAAMALAEDVRLDKPGAYTLNPGGRDPDARAIPSACRRAVRAGMLAGALAWLAAGRRT